MEISPVLIPQRSSWWFMLIMYHQISCVQSVRSNLWSQSAGPAVWRVFLSGFGLCFFFFFFFRLMAGALNSEWLSAKEKAGMWLYVCLWKQTSHKQTLRVPPLKQVTGLLKEWRSTLLSIFLSMLLLISLSACDRYRKDRFADKWPFLHLALKCTLSPVVMVCFSVLGSQTVKLSHGFDQVFGKYAKD